MRRLAVSLLALLFAAACTDSAGSNASDASSDGTTIQVPEDSGATLDAGDGSAPVASTFRVANLSPDLGAVDVCLRAAASSAWSGPLFASQADAGNAGDADAAAYGVPTATVSDYVKMNGSGTYDVALVPSGALSCASPLALGQLTLDAGKWTTVVVMGLAHADAGTLGALRVAGFTEDATQDPAQARVRFISAVFDDGAFRAQIASGALRVDVATSVAPGQAAAGSTQPPKVDALGYGSLAPIADPARVVVAPVGLPEWTSAPASLGLAARSVHTAIVFDEPADGGSTFAVAWCDDIGGACTIDR